ncbi:MAG: TonB family protein [Planctomycetota bacterium]|jgi:TonB family protein
MIRIIVFFFCLFLFSGVLGQEEELEEEMISFIHYEVFPVFSKECEGLIIENCTNEKIKEFSEGFTFEINDTLDLDYTCYVGFMVETDGSVSSIEIKRSNGSNEFNKRVVEYFKTLPKFYKPAYLFNKPIKISYTVPLFYTFY